MPYVRRYKKATRKTYKKRVAKKAAITRYRPRLKMLPKSFPPRMITSMRYCTTVRLDASPLTAPVSSNFYSATSIYDPDATGVGHQPMTHDQFQEIYTHYRVLSSRISVTYCSNSISSLGHMVCGILLTPDTSSVIGDFDSIRERRQGIYKVTAGENSTPRLNFTYRSKRQYGSEDDLNAPFGSNPAEQAFFCVYVTSANNTIDATTCDCVVTIDYKVLMWEPKKLAQS